MDPAELQYQEENGGRFVLLNLLLVFRNADGRNIGETQTLRNLRLHTLNPEAPSRPLVFSAQEPMREGARELRVVVRDDTSGALGSLTAPFPPEK